MSVQYNIGELHRRRIKKFMSHVIGLQIIFQIRFRYPAIVFLGPVQPTREAFFSLVTDVSL